MDTRNGWGTFCFFNAQKDATYSLVGELPGSLLGVEGYKIDVKGNWSCFLLIRPLQSHFPLPWLFCIRNILKNRMRRFLKLVSAAALLCDLGHINHLRFILTPLSGSPLCSQAVNQALETSRAAKLVTSLHFIRNWTAFFGFADVYTNSARPHSAAPRRDGVQRCSYSLHVRSDALCSEAPALHAVLHAHMRCHTTAVSTENDCSTSLQRAGTQKGIFQNNMRTKTTTKATFWRPLQDWDAFLCFPDSWDVNCVEYEYCISASVDK